jgi:hypothetical protein
MRRMIFGKIHPITCHEGTEGEYKYSSTLSLTSALDEYGWSTPRPGRFIPDKETWYPWHRRVGGPQGRSGRVRKMLLPTGIRSPDRPGRSESLYRLSCLTPLLAVGASSVSTKRRVKTTKRDTTWLCYVLQPMKPTATLECVVQSLRRCHGSSSSARCHFRSASVSRYGYL